MENKKLQRAERLRGDKAIQRLFSEGRSGFVYPFRYFYAVGKVADSPSSILVSVPKKLFKRAVKRNVLKRRTREAYRLNKAILHCHTNIQDNGLNIAFIYAAKEVLDFNTIESGIKRILSAVGKEMASAYKETVETGLTQHSNTSQTK